MRGRVLTIGVIVGAMFAPAGVANAAKPPPKPGKTIQFASPTYGANETDLNAEITVSRSWTSSSASVKFSTTTGGTAVDGFDYASISNQTVSFAKGQSTASAFVPLLDDGVFDEPTAPTVEMVLSSPAGAKHVSLGTPSTAELSITDNDPPAAVTDLSAAAGSGSEQIDLSWTGTTGATTYNIYRGTASGAESWVDSTSNTTYTDNGLDGITTYYYYVTALTDVSGESAASNEASASPFVPDPAGIFTVPAGGSVSVTNISIAGCDYLAAAIIAGTGDSTSLGDNSSVDCQVGPAQFAGPISWTNNTTDPVEVRLRLDDTTCGGVVDMFSSDGTSASTDFSGTVDHALVTGTGPWHVTMNDSGGGCDWVDNDPTASPGNFDADVAVNPAT